MSEEDILLDFSCRIIGESVGYQPMEVIMTRLNDLVQAYGERKFRLARVLDVSDTTFGKWLNGKLPRGALKVIRLARILGVEPEELFEEDHDGRNPDAGQTAGKKES